MSTGSPLILACFLLIVGCGVSQNYRVKPSSTYLNEWQFSDLDSVLVAEKRPIAIFIHTDWCGYCSAMSQTTLENKEVKQILNKNYYFISFDGESKEEVYFQNQTFTYQPNGRTSGTHELAIQLGSVNGELAYPVFVLLDPGYEIIFQYNAFLTARQLVGVLREGLKN